MFNRNIVNIIIKYYDYNFIEEYKNKINWKYLSKNTNISYKIFEKYLDKIDWYYLSRNTNIPSSFFEKYLEDPRYSNKIDWLQLSRYMKYCDKNKIKIYFN